MRTKFLKFVLGAVAAAAFSTSAVAQKSGGTLNFVVGSKIPSYDGHIETTFGMIHPIAPFYSLLIRVNPDNPSENDFQCDVCEGDIPDAVAAGGDPISSLDLENTTPADVRSTVASALSGAQVGNLSIPEVYEFAAAYGKMFPASSSGPLSYTFKIRKDIKFHDGTPLTAADVVATYNKIIFPPEGVASSRKAFYKMVSSIEATDDYTVVFNLEYASGAFMPAMASPFNFIYSAKDLEEHGMTWHRTNINGTGPFRFVEHQPGAFVSGVKYEGYHFKGRPYLDGFKAISAPKMSARVQAIEGDRASIEFRGFPPKQRDDLVNALGDKITVQESDWNCVLMVTPNHQHKPFDDPRVRRALTLAVDRWGGSEYLSKIAIVKTVGGIVYPNHPLAATPEELEQLAGYGHDLEANRAEARRLLKESGHENLSFTFNNRGVDQPYRVVGTWLVDQWKQVGMTVDQQVNPSPVFYDILRKTSEFDVSIDFNCQSVINPIADVSKFLPSAGNNYANFEDAEIEAIYDKLARAGTFEEQRVLMREYEKMVLSDKATQAITLWWYKINPYRSYVKGWKIAPSHYLGQQLDQIWLDQ